MKAALMFLVPLVLVFLLAFAVVLGLYLWIHNDAQVRLLEQEVKSLKTEVVVKTEIEYYRGLYDSCLVLVGNVMEWGEKAYSFCRESVVVARTNDWFNHESILWTWPPAKIKMEKE